MGDLSDEVSAAFDEVNAELGEIVTLLHPDGDQDVTCLVSLDPPVQSSTEGEAEYTGVVRFPAVEDWKLKLEDTAPVKQFRIRGFDWHIVPPVGAESYGFRSISVIRHSQHHRHSGIFDINDEQAVYPPSP